MKKPTGGTASLYAEVHCKACGWPVVSACCNGAFMDFKDAGHWDWWSYCSNKGCSHHDGEGVFQDTPDWIESDSQWEKVVVK